MKLSTLSEDVRRGTREVFGNFENITSDIARRINILLFVAFLSIILYLECIGPATVQPTVKIGPSRLCLPFRKRHVFMYMYFMFIKGYSHSDCCRIQYVLTVVRQHLFSLHSTFVHIIRKKKLFYLCYIIQIFFSCFFLKFSATSD